ncbi:MULTISPECIES: lipoprotein [unclassified Micromonospora]|uniref:lipoprotein n=1 Tax=Micromonospora TaxID=1873 RepID=UPI00098D28CA|nr:MULTISPECIES: lipoprotein [unclassified Micromonospora]MDI5941453.1 lipoprotein [Micromonospora sp. DH15]
MLRRIGAVLLAVLCTVPAAGCADEGTRAATSYGPSPVVTGPPWYDEVAPAEAGLTVGAPGSPCELPVTFSLPTGWTPEAVAEEATITLGGARLRCEIDAKPAGSVGFLRVWAADGSTGDGRATLEGFLADYGRVSEIEYRRVRRGPLDLVEATFLQRSEFSGPNRQRALVADTLGGGPVLLTLGGMDTDEFEDMFPAYQLATRTFQVN